MARGPVTVAIMNAKGGVGKSTITMLLSEALTNQRNKRVLVIDADPQGNISTMLVGRGTLQARCDQELTLAGLIKGCSEDTSNVAIANYIVINASNLRGPGRPHVLPGSVETAWIEREVMTRDGPGHDGLSIARVAEVLAPVKTNYDYILVDCPPSISYFTEWWLQTSDLILSPAKPDYLSHQGLRLLLALREKARTDGRTLGRDLGVVVNMKRGRETDADHIYHQSNLAKDRSISLFKTEIRMRVELQHCAEFEMSSRRTMLSRLTGKTPGNISFRDKYGRESDSITDLADEFMARCDEVLS